MILWHQNNKQHGCVFLFSGLIYLPSISACSRFYVGVAGRTSACYFYLCYSGGGVYPNVFSIFSFFQDSTGNCCTRFSVNVSFLDWVPWSVTEESFIEFPLRKEDFGCGVKGDNCLWICCWQFGAYGLWGKGVIDTREVSSDIVWVEDGCMKFLTLSNAGRWIEWIVGLMTEGGVGPCYLGGRLFNFAWLIAELKSGEGVWLGLFWWLTLSIKGTFIMKYCCGVATWGGTKLFPFMLLLSVIK